MHNIQENPQMYDVDHQTPDLNVGMDKVTLDIVCPQYSSNTKIRKTNISINMLDDYEPHSLQHHYHDQDHYQKPVYRRNPFEIIVHEEENSLNFKHSEELIGTDDNFIKMEPQIQYQNAFLNGENLLQNNTCEKQKEDKKPNKILTKLQYKQETREQKVNRYLQKKQKRVWEKKISYACRKKVADRRDRANGRFVKKIDKSVTSDVKLQSAQSKFSENISMNSAENLDDDLYIPFDFLEIKSNLKKRMNKTFQIGRSK